MKRFLLLMGQRCTSDSSRCHGPRMRATQVMSAPNDLVSRRPNWMAHAEFTLRPRFARTGVVGHDSSGYCSNFFTSSAIATVLLVSVVTRRGLPSRSKK